MGEDKLDINKLTPVIEKNNELTKSIIVEEDTKKLNNLIQLFNTNQIKRNIIRSATLNDVLDGVAVQMKKRIEDHPDNFSNSEITEWLKTAQSVLDKKENYNIDNIAPIQLNQVNINLNPEDKLSRESRDKIIDIINNIKSKAKLNKEPEINDVEEQTITIKENIDTNTKDYNSDKPNDEGIIEIDTYNDNKENEDDSTI